MKNRSTAACPYCCSSDIWQPHHHTWVDRLLARFGYERFECRKCRRVHCRKMIRVPRQPAAPAPPQSEPSGVG